MKILSAKQIRDWDQYTIQHEPISSVDLMERAAHKCFDWIAENIPFFKPIYVFCGPGNNGGDGLAIARLLFLTGRKVSVYILESSQYAADFSLNLERLATLEIDVSYLRSQRDFPTIKQQVIVDALYGAGLNRPLEGIAGLLVDHINHANSAVISIDIASGLFSDKTYVNNPVIRPTYTLTFQVLKLAFLLPENESYSGAVHVLDIGLHPAFFQQLTPDFEQITIEKIQTIYKPRKPFSHKGNYGNLLLMAGSHGMMGAAVLAAKACMRSGAGKLTCYVPTCGYSILQMSVPEAMCLTDKGEKYITAPVFSGTFDAIAAGPGMGLHISHTLLEYLFAQKAALVLDADALNLLATHKHLYGSIPPHSILTPHPKEFDRLFGKSDTHLDRILLAKEKAKALQVYIVLKGRFSYIATPSGRGYFNATGNPGMATGGSGDVLTGILLGLLGQYTSADAVLSGVYLHGLAGDLAAGYRSEEALMAGDIVDSLGAAFHRIVHTDIKKALP